MTPEEFRAARAALGLSQAKMAQRLGVEGNTVWRWEKGTHPIPKWAAIIVKGN
jgi:transcriptional regulator with XRE-family HTH domain